jgi:hypothetical protein
MNILIIGNGFDVAHGLPTKYMEFLNWINCMDKVVEKGLKSKEVESLCEKVDDKIKDLINEKCENNELREEEYDEYANNNFWCSYFKELIEDKNKKTGLGDNWIDFEKEIKKYIGRINEKFFKRECKNITSFIYKNFYKTENRKTYKDFIEKLEDDLERLKNLFEFYLVNYVEKLDIKKISPDISDLTDDREGRKSTDNRKLTIDRIISFNYTHTYERIYKKSPDEQKIEYDFVHGEIRNEFNKRYEENKDIKNNIVIGVDEELDNEPKDIDLEFLVFKKYYQRIFNQNDCKYKDWIYEIRESKNACENFMKEYDKSYIKDSTSHISKIKFEEMKEMHHLYIFGHSLDETDKDVLRELILNDNVETTIYAHDEIARRKQITNLIKIIGPNELIRKAGEHSINFKIQKKMD